MSSSLQTESQRSGGSLLGSPRQPVSPSCTACSETAPSAWSCRTLRQATRLFWRGKSGSQVQGLAIVPTCVRMEIVTREKVMARGRRDLVGPRVVSEAPRPARAGARGLVPALRHWWPVPARTLGPTFPIGLGEPEPEWTPQERIPYGLWGVSRAPRSGCRGAQGGPPLAAPSHLHPGGRKQRDTADGASRGRCPLIAPRPAASAEKRDTVTRPRPRGR